ERHPVDGRRVAAPAIPTACARSLPGTAAALGFPVRRSREQGFTLVELMIVVAIIAILAAIYVFGFLGSTRKTHSVSEVTAMFAELSRAESQYAVEHNGYFSTGTDSSDIFPASPGAQSQAVGTLPAAWSAVNIQVQSQNLYCGYVAVAG